MPSLSSLPSMASLPSHLSNIPRPSLTLHSLQSRLSSMNANHLTFPGSFSGFSSPFSSAFTALRDEDASPFAPSVEDDREGEDDDESSVDGGLAVATMRESDAVAMQVDDGEVEGGQGEEEEVDQDEEEVRDGSDGLIAPPSPPAGSVSSTSSLSHTDGDDEDDDMPASPSSLSTASSSSYPPSSSSAPSPLPVVPFSSLTWLHICIAGANGKEDKLAANIRRAHPHCVVEGEAERANREEKEREDKERRERRQREGRDGREHEDDDADESGDDDEVEADEKEDEWDAMLATDDGTAAEEKELERLEVRKRERQNSLDARSESSSSGSASGIAHSSSFSHGVESMDDGFDDDSSNEGVIAAVRMLLGNKACLVQFVDVSTASLTSGSCRPRAAQPANRR